MKQVFMVLSIMVVGLAALSLVGDAQAAEVTPLYPGNGGNGGNGRGPAAGDGTGIPMEQNINLDGLLDDAMAASIADGLGIDVEVQKAREAAGETLVEIGISLGYEVDYILALHDEARIDALNQAAADGLITQEQADWLISRVALGQYNVGTGTCDGDCSQTAVSQNSRMNRQNRLGNCVYIAQ